MPKKMSKAKKIYIDYGSDSYKEGLSDGIGQGKKEMFEEAWKHTPIALLDNKQNLWWAKMFYKYHGTLEQKLKEVKNG